MKSVGTAGKCVRGDQGIPNPSFCQLVVHIMIDANPIRRPPVQISNARGPVRTLNGRVMFQLCKIRASMHAYPRSKLMYSNNTESI